MTPSGGGRGARPPFNERAFHRWVARHLPAGRLGDLPIGDDAAALVPRPGEVAVVTVDSLVEGTHFLARSPPRLVGRAATAVSLSDLAAKGARPAGLLLALVLPASTARRWAEEVVLGAEAAAEAAGAHVVGGDTKGGPVRAVVSTAIGWGRRGRLAPRSRARPGDLLVTTGTVGRGGLAARALARSGRPSAGLSGLLRIDPRVREGAALARYARAMVDTSDGLAEACRLMATASREQLVVDERSIPYAPPLDRGRLPPDRRRAIAFYGGDYELLAAVPPPYVARAVRAVKAVGGRLTVIGRVGRGRGAVLRSPDGRLVRMPAPGWDPFGAPLPRHRGSPSQS